MRDARARRCQRVELAAVNRHEAVTSRVQKASSQGPTHEVQSVLRGRCPASFAGNAPSRPEQYDDVAGRGDRSGVHGV